MPIYEYFCRNCRKRVSIFFRTISAAQNQTAICPECASAELHRLMSRVRVLKSDDSRMDDLADPSMLAGLENEDPRALASFMRRMSDEMGEPMDAEMNEMVGRLEAGESPEEIEKSLPDVGDAGSGDDISGE
ncbi:MAG: zinc ribbon domain-containing protein [Caldilineaceae bacterium]